MSKYIDVVLVDTAMYGRKVRLAPAWSRLQPGDRVKIQVDFTPFEIEGTVGDVATFNINDEDFRLLRSFAGTSLHNNFEADMKVTKKVICTDLWPDEVDDERGDENG